MGLLGKAVKGVWGWALPSNLLYGEFITNDDRETAQGAQKTTQTEVKEVKLAVGAGIAAGSNWNSKVVENPVAPLSKSPPGSGTSLGSPVQGNPSPAVHLDRPEGKRASQVSSLGSDVQKDAAQRQVRSDDLTQHAPQAVSRKAQDVGSRFQASYSDHSAAAGHMFRVEMARFYCKRKERQAALLEKAIVLCEKGQQADAKFRAELQACGVLPATIDAIGGPARPRAPVVTEDRRNVDKLVAKIQGPAQRKAANSTMKPITQKAHKPPKTPCPAKQQASSSAKPGPDRQAEDDEELDSNWDCTEEYMAATLHPYDPTAGANVPKLAQMKRGPSHAQCTQAAWDAWEAAHVRLWEAEEVLFLAAKEFIMANPNNYDESIIDKHLLFRERVSKEAYKIDLHTPQALRDAGRCMTAQQASTAASVWLEILYKHMVSWIPDQEVTVVTGRGLTTGCRQFVAVGVMLALMQSQGMVKRFWPVSKCGAYRVVLGVPM